MVSKNDREYLKTRYFRLSSEYSLVPYNRIEQKLYAQVARYKINEDEVFGILYHEKDHSFTVIDQDTALLLYTMKEVGKLPHYILNNWDASIVAELKFMLGRGVLELEISHKHKDFISGTEALKLLQNTDNFSISDINKDAIFHAMSMLPTDYMTLSSILYLFNRKPVSASLSKTLSNANSVKQFLGLNAHTAKTKKNSTQWTMLQDTEGWIVFQSKKDFQKPKLISNQTYKLYMSPNSLDIFSKIFFDVATLLYNSKAFQFKIGNDAFGLQRPDKWVAYFYDKASLFEAIGLLEDKMGDISAQEVPFSCHSDVKWLSWGKDPQQYESTSWRWLICSEIAHAILDVPAHELPKILSMQEIETTVWPYIKIRLEREGINAETLEPME